MNIKHKVFDPIARDWKDCDSNVVDISTFVAPNRMLCPKCRKVFTGVAIDAETNEVVGYVDESPRPEPPRNPERPGWATRILRALLRWTE